MRPTAIGENFLRLPPRLAAISRAGCRTTGDERSANQTLRVVNVDQDDGVRATLCGDPGTQSRPLEACLRDGLCRKNVVVEIGDRVRIARFGLQRYGQTVAAAKWSQVRKRPS